MRYLAFCCLALMIFGLNPTTVAQSADGAAISRSGKKNSKSTVPKKEDCGVLLHQAQGKGMIKSRLSSTVLNSSWLNKIVAYDLKGQVFVVASLKEKGEEGRQEQIFCRVPYYKWDRFNFDPHLSTYDKRFKKYIMDYRCDCE